MPVNPKLRLVIEFLNPQAEYRFKHFYNQQNIKLDLGTCEPFTARLVSMEEAPREIDITFIEECAAIGEQIAENLSNIVSTSSIITIDNSGMKEFINITPTWTVVITNSDTGWRDSFGIAKCTRQTCMDVLHTRYPDMGDIVFVSMEYNTLYFITAKSVELYCKEQEVKPLSLDLIFDKWHIPTI